MPIAFVNGIHIAYHRIGQGVPVIFIPPPMVGTFVFYKQAIELSRHFDVILVELRGHARSDVSKEYLSYSIIVDDIRALMDELNIDRAVLVGYSLAGQIVLEFLSKYPSRAYGAVPVSTFSEVSDLRLKTELNTALQLVEHSGMHTLAFCLALANADTVRALRNMYRTGVASNRRNVIDLFREALTYQCTERLAEIGMPIRLIFGAKDVRLFRYRDLLSQCLPNATKVIIPGVSHQVPTKAAETLNAEIRDFVTYLHT
ncbi:alpha/beta hydrolase [Alicyclobacillus fastidiosus]|uniref:Alpha/beta hydrolase n=1 Tax=Alicyclobacillus fastidiosus TaxID=392011 RepID=A0ABY6ZM82_9BACL|nr:alpha/beta hydrolase [Alicyclobacillus fastidiosus]WAH43311.1 alpha/beta hydrolase [Alicyclobacillus fastidiosus]GMA65363.1 hydrolase [Alicyclobacillus fastidiosus]